MSFRKPVLVTVLGLMITAAVLAGNAKIDSPLDTYLMKVDDTELVPAFILMDERPDIEGLRALVKGIPRSERSEIVMAQLDELARITQRDLLDYLEWEKGRGRVTRYSTNRMCNGINLMAVPDVIRVVAERQDVYIVLANEEQQVIPDQPEDGGFNELDEMAWGLVTVEVQEVWDMGIYGQGIIIAIIDTGVNYNHLDLADHLWNGGPGIPNHGWDFENDDDNPMDDNGHGTHCSGTALGDGTAGNETGVAPQASLMCIKTLNSWGGGARGTTWDGMDFALDHGADIISMSLGWTFESNTNKQTWRENFEVLDAAGVVSCVAAGNERNWYFPPDAVRTPGNVPSPWRHPDEVAAGGRGGVITVGATDISDNIAYFSSPGPVTWSSVPGYWDWGGVGMICPDISAPGVNVLSLDYSNNNGYLDGWNGTSMATPHAAGLVALMLSLDPDLETEEVDQIIQITALDLGDEGKDNDFGAGRIRAPEAIEAVGGGQPGDLTLVADPVNPPILIQQWGGNFSFDVAIQNISGGTYIFDAWTEAILPNGNEYGPILLYEGLTLLNNQTLTATPTQYVPGYAPSGWYSYVVKVGSYPNEIVSDSFEFGKIPVNEPAEFGIEDNSGWTLTGWFSEEITCSVNEAIPVEFKLDRVYPNPFNPSTTVAVGLPNSANLSVIVFNVVGQKVAVLADGTFSRGYHNLTFDARELTSGVYFIRASVSGKLNVVRKVMLLK